MSNVFLGKLLENVTTEIEATIKETIKKTFGKKAKALVSSGIVTHEELRKFCVTHNIPVPTITTTRATPTPQSMGARC